MARSSWWIAASVLALLLFCAGFTDCGKTSSTGAGTPAGPAPIAAASSEAPSAAAGIEHSALDLRTAIQDVARETIPSVVHIEVTQRQEATSPLLPFENDPFFRYFFDVPQMPRKFRRELKGLGTGMIMDAEGHILTNNHVVAGASEIRVFLSDGSQYPGKLVGADPKTDLATLSISAGNPLPHVTFGDSDEVEVGEWVVAIGHPRGLDETVTQGIISAKHRTGILDPSGYQDYLQTDAAINPGNSGGPLLDLQGRVIGVNAAIASQSGGFEGIGFAIPSNMALHVANALIAHGKVERGWLGVSVQDLTPVLAEKFGLSTTKGALVADVMKDSPAERAGLARGDVIVTYRGQPVADAGVLRNAVANTPIGEKAEIARWRGGKQEKLSVTIGSLEDAAKAMLGSVEQRFGAKLRPLTPKETERFGLGPDQGVAIQSVERGGPLGEAGFEVDDVLIEINGEPIAGVEGLVQSVSALPHHQQVRIKAGDHRRGDTGWVAVTLR